MGNNTNIGLKQSQQQRQCVPMSLQDALLSLSLSVRLSANFVSLSLLQSKYVGDNVCVCLCVCERVDVVCV